MCGWLNKINFWNDLRQKHRFFPDFWLKMRMKGNEIQKHCITCWSFFQIAFRYKIKVSIFLQFLSIFFLHLPDLLIAITILMKRVKSYRIHKKYQIVNRKICFQHFAISLTFFNSISSVFIIILRIFAIFLPFFFAFFLFSDLQKYLFSSGIIWWKNMLICILWEIFLLFRIVEHSIIRTIYEEKRILVVVYVLKWWRIW